MWSTHNVRFLFAKTEFRYTFSILFRDELGIVKKKNANKFTRKTTERGDVFIITYDDKTRRSSSLFVSFHFFLFFRLYFTRWFDRSLVRTNLNWFQDEKD